MNQIKQVIPALEVSMISKNFGGLTALEKVSFKVYPQEILGIIGPNGAGKTTLFNVISGMVLPMGGNVFYFGTDITSMPPHQRRRGGLCRTYQKVRLFESMTVKENILIPAMECTTDGNWKNKVDDVLENLALSTQRHRYTHELTLADRKRVEIARAIVGNCRVLMLDESLSGLNREEADTLISVIKNLNHNYEVTILVVEHVMSIIMSLAQRLIVLHYGKVIAEGNSQSVVSNPIVNEAYLGTKAR